jgi:hypothetical protein
MSKQLVRASLFLYLLFLSVLSYGQYQSKGIIQIKNSTGHLVTAHLILEANSIDSVKAYVHGVEPTANTAFNNILLLNLNTNDINTTSENFLNTIFHYDYIDLNKITCPENTSGICALNSTIDASNADWTDFYSKTKLFVENTFRSIKSFFLTKNIQDGVVTISKNNNSNESFNYPFSLELRNGSDVVIALVDRASDAPSVTGLNSFIKIYGETAEQIGNQIFDVIAAAKPNDISNDRNGFLLQNKVTFDNIELSIKKLKGKYFDVMAIPVRSGTIKINNTIPIYKELKEDCIDYQAVKGYLLKEGNKEDVLLLQSDNFYETKWKFVPTNASIPHIGYFKRRKNDNSEEVDNNIALSKEVNLKKDGKFFRICNQMVGSLAIDSIDITILDGYIYNFSFRIKDGHAYPSILKSQSYNIKYSLRDLYKARLSFYNAPYLRLGLDNKSPLYKGDSYFVRASEIFEFDHPENLSNNIFTAIDTVLRLNTSNSQFPSVKKVREKNVLSIVDLDVFADLVGFLNEEKPNGLLQTELKVSLFGFRKPLGQKYAFKSRAYFFHRGEVRLRFSKLDNNNKYLNLLKADDTKYFHTFNLYQYQKLFFDLKTEIFTVQASGSEFSIYARAGLLISSIRDSLIQKDGAATIYTPDEFGHPSFKYSIGHMLRFFRTHDINVDIDLEGIYINPSTKKYVLSKSEYDDFDNSKNTYTPTAKMGFLFNPKFIFTYNLDPGRTRRIIMRMEVVKELKNPGNKFHVLQIGYSADLNRFINLNKPHNTNF